MVLKDFMEPIYLDGMARKSSQMILSHPEYLRDLDMLSQAVNNTEWVEGRRMRREIVRQGPCIIVTTAGMLEGGPVIDYLSLLHKDHSSNIILTGYQVEDTNGRLLTEEGYVIDQDTGRRFKVDMDIYQFDFSAHSDQQDLKKLVEDTDPQQVILMHGDEEGIEGLKSELDGYNVHTPRVGDVIEV